MRLKPLPSPRSPSSVSCGCGGGGGGCGLAAMMRFDGPSRPGSRRPSYRNTPPMPNPATGPPPNETRSSQGQPLTPMRSLMAVSLPPSRESGGFEVRSGAPESAAPLLRLRAPARATRGQRELRNGCDLASMSRSRAHEGAHDQQSLARRAECACAWPCPAAARRRAERALCDSLEILAGTPSRRARSRRTGYASPVTARCPARARGRASGTYTTRLPNGRPHAERRTDAAHGRTPQRSLKVVSKRPYDGAGAGTDQERRNADAVHRRLTDAAVSREEACVLDYRLLIEGETGYLTAAKREVLHVGKLTREASGSQDRRS